MNNDFFDKTILVTGGASGIGNAIAREFTNAGAKVIVAGRRASQELEKSEMVNIDYVQTDVSDESELVRLMAHIRQRYGSLACAINNAGTEGKGTPVVNETVENYRSVFDINVLGTLLAMKHESRLMLEGDGGAIVNIASIAGLIGFPGASVYVASKHAVIGLTKSAALEFADKDIRVNAIAPAAIQTKMLDRFLGHDDDAKAAFTRLHPVGRVGTPGEVAAAALFLCSSGASFITGHTLTVDGGYTAQ